MGHSLFKVQLLKKLWVHLSAQETFGLTPPDRIQRSGVPLGAVRRNELAHILDIERQLHELKRGYASLDAAGKWLQAADIKGLSDVRFSPIIERQEVEQREPETLPDIQVMLEQAGEWQRYEALERLLRLQKLYLLAERIILGMSTDDGVDKQALDPRWFSRWRACACESPNGGLQQLWAKILVRELQFTGTTSLHSLSFLAHCRVQDADNLKTLSTWLCGDFVHSSALQPLLSESDQNVLSNLEALGLLRGVTDGPMLKQLVSSRSDRYLYRLPLWDGELVIRSDLADDQLSVPVFLVSPLGMELVELVAESLDERYLLRVTQDLMSKGFSVNYRRNPERGSLRQQSMT